MMTNAISILTDLQIPHRLFKHHTRPGSLEQAALLRGQMPEQVVRSILFRLSELGFVMALVSGLSQISWRNLRTYLGARRIALATSEEVLSITGYEIGAVSPFGLKQPIRILVDSNILKQDEISIGSGEHGLAIILNAADLLTALPKAEMVDLLDETN